MSNTDLLGAHVSTAGGFIQAPPRAKATAATAGSGTALGDEFEELAAIVALLPAEHRWRVGVCVDTCHVYSAGYDLVGDYDGVMHRFADVIGPERLRVLHLNDSKTPFASRR